MKAGIHWGGADAKWTREKQAAAHLHVAAGNAVSPVCLHHLQHVQDVRQVGHQVGRARDAMVGPCVVPHMLDHVRAPRCRPAALAHRKRDLQKRLVKRRAGGVG